MTTFVRAPEAARRLGVSTATLYSYVSRGRVHRRLAADGRSSLFEVAELDRLAERTRRPVPPPPTIDVRISTAITQLDDDGLRYRGIPVENLVDEPFESVAELLWSGSIPAERPRWVAPKVVERVDRSVMGMIRLATSLPTNDDAPSAAATLLASIPAAFGGPISARRPFDERAVRVWTRRPSPELVRAVNTTLVLLADHELATSTLAVRVAASVRSSPTASIIAGLAALDGDLHGSASLHVHRFFEQVEASDALHVLDDLRARRLRVPGFGHKIYRQRDPRFDILLDRVRDLADPDGRLAVVQSVLDVSGTVVAHHPNIDLALGALSYVAGLPADLPLFAIARIAGLAAHYIEELDERPVRYRGLAR